MMLKKLAFVTIAATSMMIASAQTPQPQHTQKAETTATKHAPAKKDHQAKGTTHKAKASKHTSKKAHKTAKNEMQEQ